MLLPSPLPSEPFLPPLKPTRPALKSTGAYQPHYQPQSTTTALLASCRALQNLLNTTPALSCQTKPSPSQREKQRRTNTRVPSSHSSTSCRSSPRKPTPPRGTKKRRRDDYEVDEKGVLHSPEADQENYGYSTPKRQRRIPLSMPLGLCAADFQSLQDPGPPALDTVQLNMPLSPLRKSPSPPLTPSTGTSWTADDDRALVSTVLEKLQLSRYEWNDCARILGKDKDTLGRRWRMLVGDGDVGLRRGRGSRGRMELDVGSW